MRRLVVYTVASTVVVLLTGEITARSLFGLGTPPLSVTHPTIEYMFAPNQDVHRFGNRQLYNEFGMRSLPMTEVSQERRILVFGDSVLNGGNLSDHADLATTLATDQDTFFGNVSAGSWGPQNISAWIIEYGFLEADTMILVLSSHDLTDFPQFTPLDSRTHPTHTPPFALVEGIERYFLKFLGVQRALQPVEQGKEDDVPPSRPADLEAGSADLHALLDLASSQSVRACLVLHATQTEVDEGPVEQRQHFFTVFAKRGVPVIDAIEPMAKARAAKGTPYRDNIHINDTGQRILANLLHECAGLATVPHPRGLSNL